MKPLMYPNRIADLNILDTFRNIIDSVNQVIAQVQANSDAIGSLSGKPSSQVPIPVPVRQGGTGAETAVGALGNLGVIYGQYVPVLTTTANLTAAASLSCQFVQIGTMVIVSVGLSGVQPTAAGGTLTTLALSLPVPAVFKAAQNLAGAASAEIVNNAGEFYADTVNQRAILEFRAASNASGAWYGMFMYNTSPAS